MADADQFEVFTKTSKAFLPALVELREQLAAQNADGKVVLTCQSRTLPEEIKITLDLGQNRFVFQCDSNEVVGLLLLQLRCRRFRRVNGFDGLLSDPSIEPLCIAIPEAVARSRDLLATEAASAALQSEIEPILTRHAIPLDRGRRVPESLIDKGRAQVLASEYMSQHPHIFNHPDISRRRIFHVDEIRDWLLPRLKRETDDPVEVKLLCYSVFQAVQDAWLASQNWELATKR